MKNAFFAVSFLLTFNLVNASEDMIAYTSSNSSYVNLYSVDGEARFVNGELVLPSMSKVIIYNAGGSVIYQNEKVKVVDCSGWQNGSYTAVINNATTFRFVK